MKSSLKYIFSALSLIVLCLSCTVAQAKGKTDWEEDGLKGKVKEVRTYNVKENAGALEKSFIRRKIKYDKNGNRLVEEHYNEYDEKDGELSSRLVYKYKRKKNYIERLEYDNYKKLIEKTLYDKNRIKIEDEDFIYGVNYCWRTVNKYDQNGKIIEEIHFVNDSLLEKTIYRYDDKGNLTEEKHSDSPTRWENRKFINKYDENGNLVEIEEYNFAGKLSYSTVYKYNDKKKCVEETIFDSDKKMCSHLTNKYNDQGKKIESIHTVSNNELMQRDVYIIDDKGKTSVSLRYDPDGELGRIAVSKFDNAGNAIETNIYVGFDRIFYFGSIIEYDYYK